MQRKLVLAALAAAVAAFGCRDTTAPAPAGPAGEYALRTIDGNPPPQIVFTSAEATISFVGGLVVLRANGTYVDSTEVEIVTATGVGHQYDVGNGTYRISNDSVFFKGQGTATEYVMVRNGVELVQQFDGIELVYRR